MNIHEYQAKSILKSFNINVPKGKVVFEKKEAEKLVWGLESDIVAVKAQIHAGGRGKAGGVKLATSIDEVIEYTNELLGKTLFTHQTGPEGKKVNCVLLEEGCEIESEYYLGLVLDRETSTIALIASEEGGTEIEEVAKNNPEKIIKVFINPLIGLTDFQARQVAYGINLPHHLVNKAIEVMKNLYNCFIEKDCAIAEINPLVITKDNNILALDAKLNFDSNALYRQKDIFALRDESEEDAKEVEASLHGLSYISLNGNIGCMVNGAGLAMATMDIIKHYGGSPANFLDVGGSATESKICKALNIIISDTNVKGVFINIFGGIMKCDVIARGVVTALKDYELDLPLVVRLEGTNVEEGKQILRSSSLNINLVSSLSEGAKAIVMLTEDK